MFRYELGKHLCELEKHLFQLGKHLFQLGKHLYELGKRFCELGKHFYELGKHFCELGKHFYELGKYPCEIVFFVYQLEMEENEMIVCFVSRHVARCRYEEKKENNENTRKVVLARIVEFPRIFIVIDFEVIMEKVRGFGEVRIRAYFELAAIQMKLLLTILAFTWTNLGLTQTFPDSLIIKYNIYKIISTVNSTTQSTVFEIHYNKEGRVIKTTTKEKGNKYTDSDSSVTIYFYKDTFCIKEVSKEYTKKKLVGADTIDYTYEYDNVGRQASKLTTESNGRIVKETYRWGDYNLIDTIRFYSNDMMIKTAGANSSTSVYSNTSKLTNVKINTWDANHKIYKTSECRIQPSWEKDSSLCREIEYYKSGDTVIQKIKQGYQSVNYVKEFFISDNEKYEESERGDKAFIFYKRNNKGLITEIKRTEQQLEGPFNSITRLQYFFR